MPVHRYAETVIYRIFYALDRCGAGRLSLRDLKRSVPQPGQTPTVQGLLHTTVRLRQ